LIYIVSYIAVGGIAGMVNSPERQLRRRLVQQEKENYKHRGEVFYQGLHCPKCGNQLTGGGLSAKAGWGSDAGFDQEAMKQGVLKCSQCGQQLQL
jgi:transcription elongation factor Elf1